MAILEVPPGDQAAGKFQQQVKAPQNRKSFAFDEDHSYASECE